MMSAEGIEWLARNLEKYEADPLQCKFVAELLDEILKGAYTPEQLGQLFAEDRIGVTPEPDEDDVVEELLGELEYLVRQYSR